MADGSPWGRKLPPDQRRRLAFACESAVFQCLCNAADDSAKEEGWRMQADKLERKFTTDFGRHYSHFTVTANEVADG